MSRTNAPTFLHLWFYQQERKKTKTTRLPMSCMLRGQGSPWDCSRTVFGLLPPFYSCADFRRLRGFAENRYPREQRWNMLVVIYDSSPPSSWGWRADSEPTEWPPQQVGRWESGGLTQRRCPINWQRYPGSDDALLGSQITVWVYSNTLSYSQAWYIF